MGEEDAPTARQLVATARIGGSTLVNYRMLSVHAVKLLCDLGSQFKGGNNGDLCATWSLMQVRGWKLRDTLGEALAELLHYGKIEQTRQGVLHRCSLYALTWHVIDECKGKLDVTPKVAGVRESA